jgi:hypothetical protein
MKGLNHCFVGWLLISARGVASAPRGPRGTPATPRAGTTMSPFAPRKEASFRGAKGDKMQTAQSREQPWLHAHRLGGAAEVITRFVVWALFVGR